MGLLIKTALTPSFQLQVNTQIKDAQMCVQLYMMKYNKDLYANMYEVALSIYLPIALHGRSRVDCITMKTVARHLVTYDPSHHHTRVNS